PNRAESQIFSNINHLNNNNDLDLERNHSNIFQQNKIIFNKLKNKKSRGIFPYLADLKKYANLPEKEKIENIASKLINYEFKDLQSAVLKCKKNNLRENSLNNEKCCLVLSFNLPKEIKKKLEIALDDSDN